MSALMVLGLLFITSVGMMAVMNMWERNTGVTSTQCRVARRRIVRDIRRGREERPVLLLHLTEEQWQSHAEAFADYCCGMGKYINFTGVIPDWLESEGLPPTPNDSATSTESGSESIQQELHRQFWTQVAQKRPQHAALAKRQIERELSVT